MKQIIYFSIVAIAAASCGKDKKDRQPYPFEVEQSCHSQALTYIEASNQCGPKSNYGLLYSDRKDNYLQCKGYLDIPNPGAYCVVNEAEIVPLQDSVKKISIRYTYLADASTDFPIGSKSLPESLMPQPVLVSESDNIERSFEQAERGDIFGDKKFEGYTMTVVGKGPFKIVDLNEPKGAGYWLEAGSGLVIAEVKIENP